MKYTSLLMAASISLLAGCSQMEQDFADVNSLSDGDLVEKVIFEVLPIKDGDNPETRASAFPNGGTVGFIWEASDTVGIYPDKGSQVYFNIEDGVGTSSVSFNGGGWALKQNSTYTSYYPFVGDIYLKRDKIPVSFAGQKQIGTTSPFVGARYYLATGASTSENGVLRFSYKTLNTIINVNATLPAGTYTKMSLTIEEPLFVEEGTYSLDDRAIVGTKFTNTLEIDLEDVVLTEEATIPIYIMSAPVDLKDKEVTVRFISSEGQHFECVKTPSKAYAAGTRYGLTCDKMEAESQPNNVIYYVSSDGNIVIPYNTNYFGASIVSNEYQNGRGIITFDGEVTSIGFNAFQGCYSLTSIMIPESVTSIGNTAFNICKSLTNVSIPESVTSIGDSAFSSCNSLVNITIPDSVTSIGNSAFRDCTSLASITIPDSVTNIGWSVFSGCTSLVNISIPETVTTIEDYAFANCRSLTRITLPESVTRIENGVFTGCTSLISITIPMSVTSIGSGVFTKCTSLMSFSGKYASTDGLFLIDYGNLIAIALGAFDCNFDIPDGITGIGDSVFSGCTSLVNISIPETVKSIGYSAFSGCSSLTSISIPAGVSRIESSTFMNCTSLTSITLPERVTIICDQSFHDCTSLTSITIPESVTRIAFSAFTNCISLTNITVLPTMPPEGGTTMFANTNNCPIYVPSESVDAYKSAQYWSDYADRIFALEPMVTFQDSSFKAYCVDNFDTNNDGNISYSEAAVVEEINVWSLSISSLEGIESFTNLRTLWCGNNELSVIDISKNALLETLECSDNHLISLDVSANTRLTWLECRNNEISSIDISNNIELSFFRCSNNPITEIDFSKNKELSDIDFELCQLSTIDVSNNSRLLSLYCMGNNITSLDVSNNEELRYLDISWTPITSVYLGNNRRLLSLWCQHTLLSTLDISKNINLYRLWCDDNPQLMDIWLSTGQSIDDFVYDEDIVTIHYKS